MTIRKPWSFILLGLLAVSLLLNCAAGGFAMPPIIRTDDFVTAAALAAAQEGVVLAPASLAHLNMGGLRFLPFTGFDSPLATVLVHRQDLSHIDPGWFDIGTRLD